jgi:hypothetical protein
VGLLFWILVISGITSCVDGVDRGFCGRPFLFWTVSSNAASIALHVAFGALCGLVGGIVLGFLIRRFRGRTTSGL